MLLLLFFALIVLFVLSCIFSNGYDKSTCRFIIRVFIVSAVMIGFLSAYGVMRTNVLDEKIRMYAKENEVIEEQIESIVCKYEDYESSTFKELMVNDASLITNAYPQLKANELVLSQIKVYCENAEKIRSLKDQQIEMSAYKWWVWNV